MKVYISPSGFVPTGGEIHQMVTDAVMNLLSAAAIEKHSGAVRPIPMIRQMFQLHGAPAEAQQRYTTGDEAARREVLASFADDELPALNDLVHAGPTRSSTGALPPSSSTTCSSSFMIKSCSGSTPAPSIPSPAPQPFLRQRRAAGLDDLASNLIAPAVDDRGGATGCVDVRADGPRPWRLPVVPRWKGASEL